MAKLGKAQIYAINWLNSQGKDLDFITTELGLSNKQVLSVIEKNQPTKESSNQIDPIKTASESTAKQIVSKNLMINHTSAKKNNQVMIMTHEASMINDELKKNLTSSQNRNSKHIFRPNEKKR